MEARLACVVFVFAFNVAILFSDSQCHAHFREGHKHRKPPLSTLQTPLERSVAEGPDVFFEISRPVGGSSSPCSALVLQHAFAYTYDLPPAVANYTPPSHCRTPWNQIVLRWSGTCKGRQFDRIAAVWFGGVEVLRTCTAEPTSSGIYWEVRKDVTRYISIFKEPQLVVLELANVVDSTYTGIFNINLTLEFYSSKRNEFLDEHQGHIALPHDDHHSEGMEREHFPSFYGKQYMHNVQDGSSDRVHSDAHYVRSVNSRPSFEFPSSSPADVIIPISKPNGFSGGHWFDLATEDDEGSSSFIPPQNIVRAVLEIYVSFHGTDEFWYSNPPNEYLEANGLTGYPGNGPFREVQIFLDDVVVGAVYPFPVIFTGGINPLFWRPAAAIGAYDLPSYDLELTPFVGSLVDGTNHTIRMQVTNADGSWPIDANLHLWLDPLTSQTIGGLLTHSAPTSFYNAESDFESLDGTFQTRAGRSIAFSGYIISSLGTISTSVSYAYAFENELIIQNSSSMEIVSQEIRTTSEVTVRTPSNVVFSQEIRSVYPFHFSCIDYTGANSGYTEECDLTHSFKRDIFTVSSSTSNFESLNNTQTATGTMTVVGSSVTAGVGALQQDYDFQSTQGCYDRFLSTSNYSTLSDITNYSCERFGRMDA